MKGKLFYRLGEMMIWACNTFFGLHNRSMAALSGNFIRTISTLELQAELNAHDSRVVLVDVRSKAEQSVSTIPGAITQHEYETKREDYADRLIVPFCTVGGRSYLYARKLVAAGIPANNYRDSILGWCRAGLPLETPDGRPTNAIHPYWRIFYVPETYDVRN